MTTYVGPTLDFPVADIDAVLTDFTSIQVERATSFGGSYALITTITLVADTTEYVYTDASGISTSYYRHRYYNTVTFIASAYSEPYPAQTAPTTSRQELRQRAAERLGLYLLPDSNFTFPGPSFTTTAAGSATTVVCAEFVEASLSDDGTATTSKRYDGAFLYLSSGTASGEEARVASGAPTGALNITTGTFTVAPTLSAAPGSGVTVEGYLGRLSASRWNRLLDDARLDLWYPADVQLAGITSQTEYPLPYFVERDEQVLRMDHSYGTTARQHLLTYGEDFTIEAQEGGGCLLRMPYSLGQNSVYTLRVMRHPAPFTSDTAAIPMAEQYQRLWWLTACLRAAQLLAQGPDRVVENVKGWQDRFVELTKEVQGLQAEIGTWRRQRSPRRTPMAYVGGTWGMGQRW